MTVCSNAKIKSLFDVAGPPTPTESSLRGFVTTIAVVNRCLRTWAGHSRLSPLNILLIFTSLMFCTLQNKTRTSLNKAPFIYLAIKATWLAKTFTGGWNSFIKTPFFSLLKRDLMANTWSDHFMHSWCFIRRSIKEAEQTRVVVQAHRPLTVTHRKTSHCHSVTHSA